MGMAMEEVVEVEEEVEAARRRAIRWRWMLPPVRVEDRKKSERESERC